MTPFRFLFLFASSTRAIHLRHLSKHRVTSEYLLANIGLATAENESSKVCSEAYLLQQQSLDPSFSAQLRYACVADCTACEGVRGTLDPADTWAGHAEIFCCTAPCVAAAIESLWEQIPRQLCVPGKVISQLKKDTLLLFKNSFSEIGRNIRRNSNNIYQNLCKHCILKITLVYIPEIDIYQQQFDLPFARSRIRLIVSPAS